jgi:hypothetical protein
VGADIFIGSLVGGAGLQSALQKIPRYVSQLSKLSQLLKVMAIGKMSELNSRLRDIFPKYLRSKDSENLVSDANEFAKLNSPDLALDVLRCGLGVK